MKKIKYISFHRYTFGELNIFDELNIFGELNIFDEFNIFDESIFKRDEQSKLNSDVHYKKQGKTEMTANKE